MHTPRLYNTTTAVLDQRDLTIEDFPIRSQDHALIGGSVRRFEVVGYDYPAGEPRLLVTYSVWGGYDQTALYTPDELWALMDDA